MQREKLLRLVLSGFAVLAIAFLLVLVSSLGNRQNKAPADPFADLSLSQTTKRWHNGQRVWATRLSQDQHLALGADHSCRQRAVCIVAAATTKSGIDLVYSRDKPPQIDDSQNWVGGFVDPTSGSVFDLSGRSIKPANGPALTLVPL